MKIQYAHSTHLGGRQSQQDQPLCIETPDRNYLFGIFDGHGSEGHKAAEYAKLNFPLVLKSLEKNIPTSPKDTIKEIFQKVHNGMNEDDNIDTYMSGTTATIVYLHTGSNKAYIANVGDSAVLTGFKDGTCKIATCDHTCANQSELDRVKASGVARVEALQNGDDSEGPLRIFKGSLPYPGLVVTRALGDSVATKLGVLNEPDVYIHNITPNDKYMVVASDGLWDGIRNNQVNETVDKYLKDPQKASNLLTKKSINGMRKLKMDDNTTNVVIIFEELSS